VLHTGRRTQAGSKTCVKWPDENARRLGCVWCGALVGGRALRAAGEIQKLPNKKDQRTRKREKVHQGLTLRATEDRGKGHGPNWQEEIKFRRELLRGTEKSGQTTKNPCGREKTCEVITNFARNVAPPRLLEGLISTDHTIRRREKSDRTRSVLTCLCHAQKGPTRPKCHRNPTRDRSAKKRKRKS